jgi:F-type H+-transporting ATPase subunit b
VKLSAAQSQVKEIIAEARRDAQHTKDEIVAQAREEAQLERNRSLLEISTATDQALKDLAERSAGMAVELAGKIVGERLGPEDHNRLIRESVDRFKQSQPSRN